MEENKTIALSKLTPYLGALLVFLGTLRLSTFYNEFGVSIIGYLQFGEILTSFFDIIIQITSVVLITVIQQSFLIDKKKLSEDNKYKRLLSISKKTWTRFKLYLWLYLETFIYLILLAFVYFILSKLFKRPFSFLPYIVLMAISLFLLILEKELYRNLNNKQLTNRPRIITDILVYSLILLLGITYLAQQEANAIKVQKKTFGCIIQLEGGDVLKSDSLNYFIGKTDQFVFFHHQLGNTTEIIPISSVKKIITAPVKR